MKKYAILSLVLFLAGFYLKGQDVIIKKNGEEIKAKVKSVGETEIEYSKADNLEGPLYKIAKSDVVIIMYANGTKDIFTSESNRSSNPTPAEVSRPAQHYFNYDFFNRKIPFIYLGIDFSKCKLIGDGFQDSKTMFKDINTLVQKEKAKYDIRGAVRKPEPMYQYSIVEKRNADIVESSLTENTNELILYSQLQSVIDEYDMGSASSSDGLYLVVIADNLNKNYRQGFFYYVVFDGASKKILIADRLIGKAAGNGLRNFWAHSFYETIKNLHDVKFPLWKISYRR